MSVRLTQPAVSQVRAGPSISWISSTVSWASGEFIARRKLGEVGTSAVRPIREIGSWGRQSTRRPVRPHWLSATRTVAGAVGEVRHKLIPGWSVAGMEWIRTQTARAIIIPFWLTRQAAVAIRWTAHGIVWQRSHTKAIADIWSVERARVGVSMTSTRVEIRKSVASIVHFHVGAWRKSAVTVWRTAWLLTP